MRGCAEGDSFPVVRNGCCFCWEVCLDGMERGELCCGRRGCVCLGKGEMEVMRGEWGGRLWCAVGGWRGVWL
jgi:hypothetical protein